MAQEEKELLLNVLKDGLPYGLQLQITDVDKFTFNGELRVLSKNWCRLNIADPVKRAKVKNQTVPLNYIYIKPYLRSMSTMTEDEKREFEALGWRVDELDDNSPWAHNGDIDSIYKGLEWLRAHFFDYLGLIEKGLALEAPKDMYKINYL